MVRILPHSCAEAERQRITSSLQAASGCFECDDGEKFERAAQGQSALLMDGTVLRRMPGANSYECWTELDF
jgi:hypothetical protein